MTIWNILGINETKQKEEITKAYREKLTNTHPEEDPQGFMDLRRAYEEALAFSEKQEDSALQIRTPMEDWIKSLEEIYQDFDKRRAIQYWKKALENPLAISLESAQEASEKLLEFLMDNYRLSPEIFSLFSEHFGWMENREELYQHFPSNFINYIFSVIENGIYFKEDYFQGDSHADYDAYIQTATELMDATDEGDYDKAEDLLRQLEEQNIYHPYVELERGKVYLGRDNIQEACDISKELIEEYPESFPIKVFRATVLWRASEYSSAMVIYRQLSKENPEYLLAKVREIEFALEQGDYIEAKEQYYKLLKNYYYECLMQFSFDKVFQPIIEKTNQKMIPYLEEKILAGEITAKERVDLGWCYYESEQEAKALEFLQSFTPDEKTYEKYHKLRGLLHYNLKQYRECIPDLAIWLEDARDATEQEDFFKDENTKEKLPEREAQRKKLAHEVDLSKIMEIMSHAYSRVDRLELAKIFIRNAIQINSSDLSMYMTLIYYLTIEKNDVEIIKLCTDAMNTNGYVEQLLLQRAISQYNMGNYREAYEDCDSIIAMGNPMPEALIRKLLILESWGIYEEYDKVLLELKETFPQWKMTTLYEIKKIRFKEDSRKALQQLETFIHACEKDKENFAEEDIAQMYYEKFFCHLQDESDPQSDVKAMKSIESALEKAPDNLVYIVQKGSLLEKKGTPEAWQRAKQLYENTLEKYPDQLDMLICLGVLHFNAGDYATSLEYNTKVIKNYPGYTIYVHNYASDGLKFLNRYEEAVDLLRDKLKWERSFRNLLDHGTLLMETMRLEEALESLHEAREMEPEESQINCLLGMTYSLKKDQEKAEKYFKKSLETYEVGYYGYNPMYYCSRFYFMNKDYENSLKIAEEAFEKLHYPMWAAERKIESLAYLGRYEEALSFGTEIQENIDYDEEDDINLTFAMAGVHILMGEYNNAEKMLLRKYMKYKNSLFMNTKLAYIYQHRLGNLESALKCYKKAYELDRDDYHTMVNMSGCIWHILEKEKDKHGFFQAGKVRRLRQDREILFLKLNDQGEVEIKKHMPFERGCAIAGVAEIFFYNEQWEEAEKYCRLALTFPACPNCMTYEPVDAHYLLGLIEERRDNREKAIEHIGKAVESSYYNAIYKGALKRVSNK